MTHVAPPQEGDLVWSIEPGRTATIRLRSDQTRESIMVFEEVVPAGTAATPLHLHESSDEVMYVLGGEFTFKVGDRVAQGGPGTCGFMPRGMPHAWKNSGTEAGRALFIYTPAHAGKLFEEFARLVGRLPPGDSELAKIVERHDLKIVGPAPF